MTISTVTSAAVRYSASSNGYTVVLALNQSNAQRFGEVTTSIYNRRQPFPRDELALVVRGRVVYAAVVDGPVTTGQLTIDCGSPASAEQLLPSL
jgi:preprotein translocase subunit SecD